MRATYAHAVGWRKLSSIYKYLSHHYIMRRSVVFIVDNEYDSVVYRDMTMRHARQFYGSLDDEDHFGFISLDAKHGRDDIRLERCANNRPLK